MSQEILPAIVDSKRRKHLLFGAGVVVLRLAFSIKKNTVSTSSVGLLICQGPTKQIAASGMRKAFSLQIFKSRYDIVLQVIAD